MFNSIYDKLVYGRCYQKTRLHNRLETMSVGLWVFSLTGAFIVTMFAFTPNPRILIEYNAWLTVIMLCAILPVVALSYQLMTQLDRVISFCITYMTDGDYSARNYIECKLFGLSQVSDDCDARSGRYYAFCIMFMVPLYLIIASIRVPVIMPYVIGVASVIGMVWLMLYMGRFMFRTSKKLKSHIADPNAHRNNNAT